MGADPNFVNIGDLFIFPPVTGRGVVKVKYKSAAKLDKKEAAGKDDAITTYKGRGPADVELDLVWSDDDDTDDAVTAMLGDVSPRGANGGLPLAWTHSDGRYQKIHNVFVVVVEGIEGPEGEPGSGQRTAKIKVSSWAKPKAAGKGVGKTPDGWFNDNRQRVGAGVGGQGGGILDALGVPKTGFDPATGPKVKP